MTLHRSAQFGPLPPRSTPGSADEYLTLPTSENSLTNTMTLLFAATCGLAVANVYFAQPLLDAMARSLAVSPSAIGIVVTATQLGYAAGLLLIVPLGDMLNRKALILGQLVVSALALALVAMAAQWAALLGSLVVVGLMAVVVQVLVGYTAALARPEQRGRAIGRVTSGIVLGILLARLASGVIADLAGWRAVYFTSAALMLGMAGVLCKVMPAPPQVTLKLSYGQLLKSVLLLFVSERVLRDRGVLALLIFAAFSVLWTGMALPLSAPPLSLSTSQIGLFGLAGIVGALAASRAGVWADRGLGQRTSGIALALLCLAWLPIGWGEQSLLALAVGVVMLDFAVQAVHVTNQSLIFAARPDAQSRLVGAYMCFYSIGSALGAVSATQTYGLWGWAGVCWLGGLISLAAGLYWLTLSLTGR
ncbi:MFS transporter [Pseudomonas sp. nanlin1]|uniref:MFS transporter n=1 Tax=Pseudomonas sp. nanlin1 TaxID=3040605 RepID=UPI00388F14C0